MLPLLHRLAPPLVAEKKTISGWSECLAARDKNILFFQSPTDVNMWDDAAGETFHCCRLSFSLASSSACAAAALDRREIFAETKAMDECAYFTRDAIGNLKSSIEALKRYMRDPPVWFYCACIILNPLCA